jgi:DNA-binding response OmpR family regulator
MTLPLILLVDPDPDTRVILRTFLEFHGYPVLDCPDGETGLALAKQHGPALVIGDLPLDVPGHSPFTRALRSEAGSTAPVLVFTARTYEDEASRARAAGDAVVYKPASPTEVLARIERLLSPHCMSNG